MSFARFGECSCAEADGILVHVLGNGELGEADYRKLVDEIVSYKREGRLKGGTLVVGQSLPKLSQSGYMRDQLMPYRNDPMSCVVLRRR